MSSKKPSRPSSSKTALNRREALKAKRLAEARRHKRNRIIGVIAGFVALAIVVGLVVWAINRPAPAPTSTDTTTPTDTSTTPDQIIPPDGDAQKAWITMPGGTPKADALLVDIHFDYQCPYCMHVENTFASAFESLVATGDIILRQHTRTFLDNMLNNDSSVRAAVAAACVDYADNTKYAAYHNELFKNQPTKEGDGFTDDQLTKVFTATVGLVGDALGTFNDCYTNQLTSDFVTAVETNNLGVVTNQSPPNAYLFGGNTPNSDDDKGTCTGTPNSPVGTCGVPDFYVNAVRFSWSDLLNTDWTPKVDPTPTALLAFLQQRAGS